MMLLKRRKGTPGPAMHLRFVLDGSRPGRGPLAPSTPQMLRFLAGREAEGYVNDLPIMPAGSA